MTSVLAIALVLGALIFFHELGHFLVARAMGIGVKTFSLGFGPRLAGFQWGLTEYKLSAVPLGGYVQLVGESGPEDLPEGFTERHSFALRPALQRMAVVAAGPMFNFILAWLIYWGLFFSSGMYELLPEIGGVRESGPAYEAGVRAGDTVAAIDGRAVETWDDVADFIAEAGERELTMEVLRGGERLRFTLRPEMSTRDNLFGEAIATPLIGIQASGATREAPLGFFAAARVALEQTATIISLTAQGIVKLVQRVVPLETVGGPIMIGQIIHSQAQEGLANVLALTAVISVNLGLLNLLPIPVLDGGHILFFGIEALRGRPVSERVQIVTTKIGLALLLALMILAFYNDILRIITGSGPPI